MGEKTGDNLTPQRKLIELQEGFVRKCAAIVPEMNRRLLEELLPLYEPLPFSVATSQQLADRVADIKAAPAESYAGREYVEALHAWASDFHVAVPWFLLGAHASIFYTAANILPGFVFQVGDARVAPFTAEELLFSFAHPGWNPARETEDVGREKIRRAFAEKLAAYLADLRDKAHERGLATSFHTKIKKSDLPERMTWLVQRLVLGMTVEKVTEIHNADKPEQKQIDDSRVADATSDLARILGFDLPARRGRKPGNAPSK